MTAEEMQRVRLPLWLGLAGLGPFLVCAVSAYLLPMRWQALAVDVFVIYGAITASRKIFYVQALPALFGILSLMF